MVFHSPYYFNEMSNAVEKTLPYAKQENYLLRSPLFADGLWFKGIIKLYCPSAPNPILYG